MAGTFSSDDSETAKRREWSKARGVPGSLLGPLAAPLGPDGACLEIPGGVRMVD